MCTYYVGKRNSAMASLQVLAHWAPLSLPFKIDSRNGVFTRRELRSSNSAKRATSLGSLDMGPSLLTVQNYWLDRWRAYRCCKESFHKERAAVKQPTQAYTSWLGGCGASSVYRSNFLAR